ncbi:hypothetical protein ACFZCL_40850 [Streptomyces sp. NPDC008159]|uniref:hypothetical protein n=1 Tax=Streptomyces sp. NPDC008159 TaxID=3364817 RepID=UPI0036F193CA
MVTTAQPHPSNWFGREAHVVERVLTEPGSPFLLDLSGLHTVAWNDADDWG